MSILAIDHHAFDQEEPSYDGKLDQIGSGNDFGVPRAHANRPDKIIHRTFMAESGNEDAFGKRAFDLKLDSQNENHGSRKIIDDCIDQFSQFQFAEHV